MKKYLVLISLAAIYGCQSSPKTWESREPASSHNTSLAVATWKCSLADDKVYFKVMLDNTALCIKTLDKSQDPYQKCTQGYHASTESEMNYFNYKIAQKVNGLSELNDIEFKLNKDLKKHKVVNGAIPDAGEGTFPAISNYFDSKNSEIDLDVPEFRAFLVQLSTELVKISKKNKSAKPIDIIVHELEAEIDRLIAKYDVRSMKIDRQQADFLAIIRDRAPKHGPRPDPNYEYTLQSEYGSAYINIGNGSSRVLDFYYNCKN